MANKKWYGAEIVAHHNTLSEDDWHALRKQGIGGSDIGAIVGLNPKRGALSVFVEKTEGKEYEDSEPAYWGTMLEPLIADRFAAVTGHKVQRVNYVLRHPAIHIAQANIDRLIRMEDGTVAILECKTASAFLGKEWADEKIPEHYEAQVRWYMAVTGIKKAFIACLLGGQKLIIKEIVHDQEIEDYLLAEAQKFWELVVAEIAPALDGSDFAAEWLQTKFANLDPNKSIELDSGAQFLLDQVNRSKTIIKQQEEVMEIAKQNLERILGEAGAEVGTINGKTAITWGKQDMGRFDSTTFKKDFPDMYQTYKKENIKRVLRIK